MRKKLTWLMAAPLIYLCIAMVIMTLALMYLMFDYKFKGTPGRVR